MMNKLKTSFNEILNCLKIIHEMDKVVLPLISVNCLLNAINPFVAIILSSIVIDKLTMGANIHSIIYMTSVGVFIIFSITLLSGFIGKYISINKSLCFRLYYSKVGEKTLEMDYPMLEDPKSHDLRKKMQDDLNWGGGIYDVFSNFESLVEGFFSFVIAVIILVPLFSNTTFFKTRYSLYFMIFLFAIIGIVIFLDIKYFRKKLLKILDIMSSGSKLFSYFFFENGLDYKSGKDIRIYNIQDLLWGRVYKESVSSYYKSRNSISNIEGFSSGSKGLLNALIQGGSYLFVGLKALSGALSIGEVVKYAASLYRFTNSISNIIMIYDEFSIAAKRNQNTFKYFNIPDVLYKGTLPIEKRNDNEYELEFKNVSFKYPGSNNYALENFSLKLKIGERLAIVGMNGSGKTTMIKLLCRLYDPTEGQITLNGIDIKKYDYDEYMRIFSVVFQDFRLFAFSLGQNVSTSVEYDKDRVIACLKKAGFEERLHTMNKGINTSLYKAYEEDGVEISGGEEQKIALARALYKDAPFIILDEPTAALDPIAEYDIYSKFNEIVGNKTAIYISHRLSSCRFCDDIAVFHEGKLIQRGNHDTLIKNKNGKYYELWYAQAQYYNEELA